MPAEEIKDGFHGVHCLLSILNAEKAIIITLTNLPMVNGKYRNRNVGNQ
jgi:hypothetical protein